MAIDQQFHVLELVKMIHQFKINKKCSDTTECFNNIITVLEKEFTCKLMARNDEDSVHGSVTILHTPNNHDIRIEFYDKTEQPNEEHKSTLTKLGKIPTEKQIEKLLK